MQHVLQISRKIDYGLRAMIHLAGLPAGKIASLHDLATTAAPTAGTSWRGPPTTSPSWR